jgi:hypothetical protein
MGDFIDQHLPKGVYLMFSGAPHRFGVTFGILTFKAEKKDRNLNCTRHRRYSEFALSVASL